MSLYSLYKRLKNNMVTDEHMEEVRKLLKEGKPKAAWKLYKDFEKTDSKLFKL